MISRHLLRTTAIALTASTLMFSATWAVGSTPSVEGVCSQVSLGDILPLKTFRSPAAKAPEGAIARFHGTLRDQLSEFQMKPEEVTQFVSSYPSADQIWVKSLLLRLTQWGTPASLASALKQIQARSKTNSVRMVSFSPADLVSVFDYVAKKGFGLPSARFSAILPRNIQDGDVVLLTPEFKTYVESHPDFAEKLISLKVDYISLEGFDVGLHFANSLRGLEKLRGTVDQALSLIRNTGSIGNEIEYALGRVGLSQWFKLKFPQVRRQVRSIRYRTEPVHSENQSFVTKILAQINSPIPSREDIELRLARMDLHLAHLKPTNIPDIHTYLLNHLSEFVRFVDHRTLQAIVLAVGERLANLVKTLGVAPDQIDFWIPRRGKSYSLMNFMRRELEILPEAGVVTALTSIKTKDRTIVLMDDVAATGESLETGIERALNTDPARLIVMPLFVADAAKGRLRRALTRPGGRRAFLIKGQEISGSGSSSYAKEQKYSIKSWLKDTSGSSYGDINLALAFPYMSPDNNLSIFTLFFADLLTPPKATKLSDPWEATSFPDLPE